MVKHKQVYRQKIVVFKIIRKVKVLQVVVCGCFGWLRYFFDGHCSLTISGQNT